MVKDILKDKENGGILEQAKEIANDPGRNFRIAFEKAAAFSSDTKQRIKNVLGMTPHSQITKASKLDATKASSDFDKARLDKAEHTPERPPSASHGIDLDNPDAS